MQRTMLGLCGLPIRGIHGKAGSYHGSFKPRKALNNLYQNAVIGTGFNVSEYKNKNKRQWKPNVQRKNLFSEVLQETFRVYVSMRAMRTMRKYGGLDQYLLSVSKKTVGAGFAQALKERLETCVRTGTDPLKARKKTFSDITALARQDYKDRFDLSNEARKLKEQRIAVQHTMGPWPAWKGESHEKLVLERKNDNERGDLYQAVQRKQKQLEGIEDEAREIILRLAPEELKTLDKELAVLDELPDNNKEDYYNIFKEAHSGEENFTQEDHLEYPRNRQRQTIWPTGPGGSTREGLLAPELSGFDDVGKYDDPKHRISPKATYQKKVYW